MRNWSARPTTQNELVLNFVISAFFPFSKIGRVIPNDKFLTTLVQFILTLIKL